MEHRRLGHSGLLVSVVGLGCNNLGGRLDSAASRVVIHAAVDAGITLFDTADIYGEDGGSERALGASLGHRRDQVVLATKFGHAGRDMGYGPAAGAKAGRTYIRRAVHESLQRLRTDRIDLYQLHTPDAGTPMLETLAALHELVTEGKVRYLGHSNLTAWQLAEAAHVAHENGLTPFISAQNHWSLLERDVEAELVPAAEHYGVGVLPYFPLAQGMLTGKVRRGEALPPGSRIATRSGLVTDEKLAKVQALTEWGERNGRTVLEIAIGGLAGRPSVGSVIAGATKPEQVEANVRAAAWHPTPEELRAIDDIVPPPAQPEF